MTNQALFSSKDKSKKLKCRPLQFLFSTVRVKDRFCWPRSELCLLNSQRYLCLYVDLKQ